MPVSAAEAHVCSVLTYLLGAVSFLVLALLAAGAASVLLDVRQAKRQREWAKVEAKKQRNLPAAMR